MDQLPHRALRRGIIVAGIALPLTLIAALAVQGASAPDAFRRTPTPIATARHGSSTPTRTPTPTSTPTATSTARHGSSTPTKTPTSTPSGSIWHPAVVTSWQWQLTTPVDTSVNAQVYDIDGFDNAASVVASLRGQGRKAICYLDVGTWEDWRPDASQFPAAVKGASNGWPGEQWLDIRAVSIQPIMQARLDLCKDKGFDGIEPDNIDGYDNGTGFPLTAADQISYNTWLADQAHQRGMAIFLKNDSEQVRQLIAKFDGAIVEECAEDGGCDAYAPFVSAGKPVFAAEYSGGASARCAVLNAANFNGIYKDLDLDVYRVACR